MQREDERHEQGTDRKQPKYGRMIDARPAGEDEDVRQQVDGQRHDPQERHRGDVGRQKRGRAVEQAGGDEGEGQPAKAQAGGDVGLSGGYFRLFGRFGVTSSGNGTAHD